MFGDLCSASRHGGCCVCHSSRFGRHQEPYVIRKYLANAFTISIIAVAVIVAMPVMLPYMAIAEARRKRRLRACADQTDCEECGRLLGVESIERSDAVWKEAVNQRRTTYPGCKIRMARLHDVICPTCGAHYRFLEKQTKLVKLASDRSAIVGEDVEHEQVDTE